MITEDYVSFETAKLLKEKGFPQEYDVFHSKVYNEEDYEDEMVLKTELVKAGTLSSYPVGVPDPKCYCPTLQMAMKWLREVHNIFISIDIYSKDFKGNIRYCADIYMYGSRMILDTPIICNTYEEAVEAAINIVLKVILIK